MMRSFFYEHDKPCEYNDGIKHPDFDPDVVTDITEFYRRFAADPDFKVRMLPPVYDIRDVSQSGTATDSLIDCDEPEFGSQDLEYMDELRRNSQENTQRSDKSAQDVPGDTQ